MELSDSLNSLKFQLLNEHHVIKNVENHRKERRSILLQRIENTIIKLIAAIAKNDAPQFQSVDFSSLSNCYFDGRLQLKEKSMRKQRKINFLAKNSRSRFAVIVFMLSKIYKLLISYQSSTRREIYYRHKDLLKSQAAVDTAMRDICYILNAPSWEIGVTTTAKGMIAGPLLLLKSNEDIIINCQKPGGVPIPPDVLEFELMSTSVEWALIIEKDTAFQKILSNNGISKLKKCIFITGKGFPDISTRLLICRIWECFKIPILALVDADPYGLEIMCIYRFGSVAHSSYSDKLACPFVRWLGIHPSEISVLSINVTRLTLRDVQKITRLMDRPYIKENEKIRREIKILLDSQIKAEIEGVSDISTSYITDVYIPSKIHYKEYF